jgi:hypothetical protein
MFLWSCNDFHNINNFGNKGRHTIKRNILTMIINTETCLVELLYLQTSHVTFFANSTNSWSRTLLQKIINRSCSKMPTFYGTWRVIDAFTSVCYCFMLTRWVLSTPTHPVSLISILTLCHRVGHLILKTGVRSRLFVCKWRPKDPAAVGNNRGLIISYTCRQIHSQDDAWENN